MRPEELISLLLFEGENRGYDEIKKLSNLLIRLRDEGVDIAGISLRTRPGGFYSEDLERYIGQLLMWGYAIQRSPIKLTEKGRDLLKSNIDSITQKEPEKVKKITNKLVALANEAA